MAWQRAAEVPSHLYDERQSGGHWVRPRHCRHLRDYAKGARVMGAPTPLAHGSTPPQWLKKTPHHAHPLHDHLTGHAG